MHDRHWAWPLIGKPYRLGARGPDAFDCWAVAQFCWRMQLGLDVPDVGACALELTARIRAFRTCGFGGVEAFEVPVPRELDAVYMTSRSAPHHIGLWIAPDPQGGVLHALEGAGVVFQRRADLNAHGLTILTFMRLKAAG